MFGLTKAARLVLIIIFWWPWSITLATAEQPRAGPVSFCAFTIPSFTYKHTHTHSSLTWPEGCFTDGWQSGGFFNTVYRENLYSPLKMREISNFWDISSSVLSCSQHTSYFHKLINTILKSVSQLDFYCVSENNHLLIIPKACDTQAVCNGSFFVNCLFLGYPWMADVPTVLLLAPASSAAGRHGEEEDPSSQQRADRRSDPGNAAPLVCGGWGGC